MSIFTANKTSARLLVDYASEKWGPQANEKNCQLLQAAQTFRQSNNRTETRDAIFGE